MRLALVGNQNCGKTTLFNRLTGSNQHAGNFPGVTVEGKEGSLLGVKDCTVVDLPGIYSLRPYTPEEVVTRDFILDSRPDGIINIIDATNIERNLYLSLQLIVMRLPTVIAVNMMDELTGNGGSIDFKKMSEALGVPVIPVCAAKNEGVSEVADAIISAVKNKQLPRVYDFCPKGAVHRCVHSVAHVVEDHADAAGVATRFAASKIIEGDADMERRLNLSDNETELIEHAVLEMEREVGLDKNAALADMRYNFIEGLCREAVKKPRASRERERSLKIDRILTGKYTAIPAFILIMAGIFWLTFSVIGAFLSDGMALGVDCITSLADKGLAAWGVNPVVHSLIIDGVFAGVGSVLSFLPTIVVLFFFLSILEDTGYMARISFVMDKLLRKLGLSGRSIVPMLIGFGCSVPAMMATRTLASERDRKLTLFLVPFMSCSAKIPIYALFVSAFFPNYGALVMTGLYFFGILTAILVAFLYRNTVFKGKPVPFIMELPNYRMPSAKSVMLLMWDKARDFLKKAFTVIFVGTVIIWFLQTFDLRFNIVTDAESSMLAYLGKLISPVFIPLGFGDDWRIATSLVTGFAAKEAVVSTLGVLTGTGGAALTAAISSMFTLASALSFLVFSLLYVPCVAAVATVKKEINSGWKTAVFVIAQCAIAWIMGALVYFILSIIA